MGKEQALSKLGVTLTEAIDKWWSSGTAESEEWRELGSYVSDNINQLMSDAAMLALKSQIDIQKHLKEDGLLEK
jgi:hypothetical protein